MRHNQVILKGFMSASTGKVFSLAALLIGCVFSHSSGAQEKPPSNQPSPPSQQQPQKPDASTPNPTQGKPASGEPASPIQKPTKNPDSSVLEKSLLGSWETKDEQSGEILIFVFEPKGQMKYRISSSDGFSREAPAKYALQGRSANGKQKIVLDFPRSKSIKTLYALSDDGKELRIQMIDQFPGRDFPVLFKPDLCRKFTKLTQEK
jgi:hypothetical protein